MVHTVVLLATLAAAQTPEVAVVEFTGVAMLPEDEKELLKQVVTEIRGAGAKAVNRLENWVPGCMDDPGCLADQTESAFLSVEITRVGPLLQVDARCMTRDGAELFNTSNSVMSGDPLLGDALASALPNLPPPKEKAVEAPPGEGEGEGEGESGGGDAGGGGGGDDGALGEKLAKIPWWGWAGAGGAVAGVVVFGVGAAVAAGDAAILEDPASLGAEKADARVRGPVALVGAVIGVAMAAGGTTAFLISLNEE